MTDAMSPIYRFGNAELRAQERRLLVQGRDSPIGAHAFNLLLALVEHRDRIVSKKELLDIVWPGVVVEASAAPLQRCPSRQPSPMSDRASPARAGCPLDLPRSSWIVRRLIGGGANSLGDGTPQ